MTDRNPTRRRVVQATGAAALFGLAGCSGNDGDPTETETETSELQSTGTDTPTSTGTGGGDSSELTGPKNGDELPKDSNPEDGYPPEFENVPEERNIDPSSFNTLQRGGMEIKLVPTDVAYYWYVRGEARFADTRSESEFEVSHIFGSVLSPAGDGVDLPDDPVLEWPQEDRIITYCDCPHHLASLRAASLKNRGYKEVYALDKGFGDWRERNFPLAGTDPGRMPTVRVINGKTPQQHEGEFAWAYHEGSDQREAVPIQADGSYELRTKFVDVDGQSTVRVETPAYTVTGTFSELTSGTITADGTVSSSGGGTSTTTGNSTMGNSTATGNGTATGTDDSFDLRNLFR
ncbi:rhodanese-like domain-containing protein (plasmid) [Halorarum halophilum]|uniref:Rhodanese-like domain-containing protein n=1 Tax=Halorarum halophilum TaxID=2743090 RepID=A0A7D5KGF3_9EURY|nr:rhodanese-like domain-containing protein [Halobaculum halophilum]QLG29757.1 rhodanese-like domain-containing protein [Halobaculum halophilum]